MRCIRLGLSLALSASLLAQMLVVAAVAQSDPIQITGLDITPNRDGSTFQVRITATNTAGELLTRNFVVIDQPPEGAAYPIFAGDVTLTPGTTYEMPFDWTPLTGGTHRLFIDGADQPAVAVDVSGPPPPLADMPSVTVETRACIQVNLPRFTDGTCPAARGQALAPPPDMAVSPDTSQPAATCTEIGRGAGDQQIATSAQQQCPTVCNYGVIMSVGFKTATDLDLPGKPPKQHALMDANASALQGALIDNWGFPEKDLEAYTFRNITGTKDNAKRGFTHLLDKVRNLPASCTSSVVLFHFDGHARAPTSATGIQGLWAAPPSPAPDIYVAVETADSAGDDGMLGSKEAVLIFDFELADQVKQLSAALANKPNLKFRQVIVQVNTCFSGGMLSPLIEVPDVSLAWAAGKTGVCVVEGKPNLSPWVNAFVQPFAADDGTTDRKKNVTIEHAHKAAAPRRRTARTTASTARRRPSIPIPNRDSCTTEEAAGPERLLSQRIVVAHRPSSGDDVPHTFQQLDILVQSRRDQHAAEHFLRRVLDAEGGVEPRVIVTDKLASYVPAIKRVLTNTEHRRHKRLNNTANRTTR